MNVSLQGLTLNSILGILLGTFLPGFATHKLRLQKKKKTANQKKQQTKKTACIQWCMDTININNIKKQIKMDGFLKYYFENLWD